MSKRAIRIPSLKSGRRVRWTFEVSADVDGKKSARTSSASKKPTRSRTKRRTTKASSPRRETPASTPSAAAKPASKTSVLAASPAAADSPASVTAAEQPKPQPAAARGTSHSRMIAIAAMATLAIAVLALPRRSAFVPVPPADSSRSEASNLTAQEIVAAPSAASAVAPTAMPIAKPNEAMHSEGESVKKTSAKASPSLVAASSRRPAALSPIVETHEKTLAESPHVNAALTTTVTAPAPAPLMTETDARALVTITGCLETSAKDRFRLTDTEGGNAAKARSWRTGFLKKRPTPVDLVGAPDVGALQTQVGRRVSVTGVQTNRELKVSSVRVVSPSCE